MDIFGVACYPEIIKRDKERSSHDDGEGGGELIERSATGGDGRTRRYSKKTSERTKKSTDERATKQRKKQTNV